MAVVPGGAKVAVITGGLVHGIDAAGGRIAAVGCADVVVVTGEGEPRFANAIYALVRESAFVTGVAIQLVGGMMAPGLGVARVVGAGVTIVARQAYAGQAAVHSMATFKAIADIFVVALEGLSQLAAGGGVARLRAVAEVVIVTD